MIYEKLFVFAAVLCCASAAFSGHTFNNAENEVQVVDHEPLEQPNPEARAGEEPANAAESFGSCTNTACARLCAYWGYPYYRCSGDYCICYRPRLALSENGESSDADKYEELVLDKKTQDQELTRAAESMAACTNAACSRLCGALGYPYYRCSGDYCICYRPALALDEQGENPDADLGPQDFMLKQNAQDVARGAESFGACTNAACSRLCAMLGYPYYRCSGDYCICYRPQLSLDSQEGPQELILDQKAQVKELARAAESMAACTDSACSRLCGALGYPYYRCSGDYCICYRPALDANNEALNAKEYLGPQELVLDREAQAEIEITQSRRGGRELQVRILKEKPGQSVRSAQPETCNALTCNDSCRKEGYLGSECLFRGCMCYGRH